MLSYPEKNKPSRIGLLPILLALLCLASCHVNNHKTDHPEYFDGVFKYSYRLQREKALLYIDSVYKKHPEAGPGDLCREYYHKSMYYRSFRDYQKASTYADSILYVIDHSGNPKKYNLKYAEGNLLKGDILFDQGLYSYAYPYYYIEKRIVDDKTDSCDYHTYLDQLNGRLAVISYKQGDYKNAILFYKEALRNAEQDCKTGFDKYGEIQGILSNLAFSYEREGVPDSTLYYYNICLDYFVKNGGEFPEKSDFTEMARGVIYGNMGDAYMMKGDFKTADSLYKRSIRINSQKGYYNQDARITNIKLARLYLKMGKVAEAGTVLTNLGSAQHLEANDSRISFLQTRAEYYQAIGNNKAAIEDLQYYIALKDSARINKEKLVSTNINSVFQIMKQGDDISSLKKRDELKTILLVATVLFLLMGIVIITLTIKNNSQVKQHAEEVKKRNKEQQFALVALELRSRENARLASVLAHDLKNPIHAISSIASILLEEESRNANDSEMLQLIIESVSNMSAIIDDVLINRNKSGTIALNKAPTDLNELLKHSVTLLQFKAKEKEQNIQFSGDGPVIVEADSDQLWRVINNLLVNAIKFSPNKTTIKVSLKKIPDEIQVTVEDEGIGVPEEFGNKIFDLNTKTKRTGTSGEEPFGMGLYISKHIIEAHEGKIWFEKGGDKGTIFYFTLPVPHITQG